MNLEFHCHTIFSRDSLTTPEKLIKVCQRKGIDRVIITDHNTIAGARAAHSLDPDRVIVGEEIMTTGGEILAACVREEIPPGLTPAETIRRLRDQGAFISVSHPFDRWRNGSWLERDLLEIITQVDAIEVYNSRCMLPGFNRQARRFAEKHALTGTVGSDAHAAFELGQSLMVLEPFQGPDELRNVVRRAVHKVRWSPPWVHFSSRYAALYQKVTSGLDTT